MRIVHVIHTFPPFSRAGSENYTESLARAQGERGDVSVFHRISDPDRPEFEVTRSEHDGIPVARINRTFRDSESFASTYRNDAVARAFGKYLDEERPDVVHFHHVTCLSTTCVQEARRRDIAVVFTLHDFWLLCPLGQRLRRDLSLCESHTNADCVSCNAYQLSIRGGHSRVRALWRRAARISSLRLPKIIRRRLASRPFRGERDALVQIEDRNRDVHAMAAGVDRFIAPSHFLGRAYAAAGFPSERIEVSDYGFDVGGALSAEALSARQIPRGGERRIRFAYLGTWIPSKGVHLLVEAFRDLDPAAAQLDIHGHAVPFHDIHDYEDQLRTLAGSAPHIRFGGHYAPEDVPRLLSAADVLVVPSLWYENSPLTIHEGFMAGLPVVTAAHGGMQELVRDGINGLTFAPGSARSLGAALQRLIDEPELLGQLIHQRTPVKEIDDNARELEGLYRELCEARRPAGGQPPAGIDSPPTGLDSPPTGLNSPPTRPGGSRP